MLAWWGGGGDLPTDEATARLRISVDRYSSLCIAGCLLETGLPFCPPLGLIAII